MGAILKASRKDEKLSQLNAKRSHSSVQEIDGERTPQLDTNVGITEGNAIIEVCVDLQHKYTDQFR